MGTNATSLAIKQVSFKVSLLVLLYASLGTEKLAKATLYAFIKIIGWSL